MAETKQHRRAHIHVPANLGEKVADAVCSGMGTWRFVIIQSVILLIWAVLNSVGWWIWKWDVYPFIAMNLLLSCQAAYASPLILMSQNRASARDHMRDDIEAREVEELASSHQELLSINKMQLTILKQQSEILELLKQQKASRK